MNPCQFKHQYNAVPADRSDDTEKKQLEQLENILHSCFRLTEPAASCFRNTRSVDLLLVTPANTTLPFLKHYYSYYVAKRLDRFSNFSRYLLYRRLLI